MTFLCDPGRYVHKPDVQNKWDDNTLTLDTNLGSPTVYTVYRLYTGAPQALLDRGGISGVT